MKLNSIVAVHPTIDPQFEDATILDTLSEKTKKVVKDAKKSGKGWFKSLKIAGTDYNIYNVYGSAEELTEVVARFGAENIIPLGSWNWDGTRYGTIEGTPSIPLHPGLIDIMPDDVTHDENGIETSRIKTTMFKQVILRLGQGERQFY